MLNKFFVGIIAYNEESNITDVLSEISATGIVDQVIVVDDASIDATYDISRNFPGTLSFRNETNRGVGGAQKRLLEEFLKVSMDEKDVVVLMHADGQMLAEELHLFRSAFEENDVDIVLGSRLKGRKNFSDEGRRPMWKIVGDLAGCALENLAFDTRLTSYGSGFRGWTKHAVERMGFRECTDRVSYDVEIIARARMAELEMIEIPVSTVSSPKEFSYSLLKYIIDVLACIIRCTPKIWANRFKRMFAARRT